MGNCAVYFFSKSDNEQKKEIKIQKDRIHQALNLTTKTKSVNPNKDSLEIEKKIIKITLIQKIFRGYKLRKNQGLVVKSKFTSNEFIDKCDPRMNIHSDQRKFYDLIRIDNSRSYVGEWRNGMKDGFGKIYWNDGSIYIGAFVMDKVNGFGKLIHTDGDIYYGFWKDDRASGAGKYCTNKDASYSGFWEKDKQNGFGEEIWPKGSNFKGDYKDGTKSGIGVFYFENGSIYEGEFYNNDINGIGTYYLRNLLLMNLLINVTLE